MFVWTEKINSAIRTDFISQIWSGISGFVTIIFIWQILTLEVQGKYYLLLNAIFIKTLFDFGITNFVIQSYENNFSSIFKNSDIAQRLEGIAEFKGYQQKLRAVILYVSVSCMIGIFVYIIFLFDTLGPQELAISILVPLFLGLDVLSAYYAGTIAYLKKIDLVYKTKFGHAFIFSFTLWLGFLLGLGELSVVLSIGCSSAVSFLCYYYFYIKSAPFWIYKFKAYKPEKITHTVRLLYKSVSSQFFASMLNVSIVPLSSLYFGLEVGGTIAASLYVVLLIERFGMSILTSRYILYCRLSAVGAFDRLDRIVVANIRSALILSSILFLFFAGGLWILELYDLSLRARFSSFSSICFLMGTYLGWLAIYGIKLNLRSHNEENFLIIHLTIFCIFLCACHFNPISSEITEVVFTGYLFFSVSIVGLPMSIFTWWKIRHEA